MAKKLVVLCDKYPNVYADIANCAVSEVKWLDIEATQVNFGPGTFAARCMVIFDRRTYQFWVIRHDPICVVNGLATINFSINIK
jgi:hypothetical protein